MAMSFEERAKARMAKSLGKKLCDYGWRFVGNGFYNYQFISLGDVSVLVRFNANLRSIRVEVESEGYGVPNPEKTFTGEESLMDAMRWAVDSVFELYKTVTARTAPYRAGFEKYQKAVRGN